MSALLPLAGRRCLITGACGALGAALSRRLRADGADLILIGRSASALADLKAELEDGAMAARPPVGATATPHVATHVIDLATPDAIDHVSAVVTEAGGLEALINNAAVQGPIGPLWENDWDDWRNCLYFDLVLPVGLCRALVGPLGAGDRRGKIINISGGGATGPRPNFTAYGVAKAGLVRFTESFAHEVRERNIDVNAVAPGTVASAMTRAILAAGADRAGVAEINAATSAVRQKNGDAGEGAQNTDQAAALCGWLASAASDGITGRLLSAPWDPWRSLDRWRGMLAGSDVYTLRRIVPEDRGQMWADDVNREVGPETR